MTPFKQKALGWARWILSQSLFPHPRFLTALKRI
jgi:hypothetical protein